MNKVYPLDVAAYPRSQMSPPSGGIEVEGIITIHRIVRAVRRRLSLLLAVFLLTFAAVAVFTFQLKPIYTATASVIVNTRDQKVIDIGAVLSGMPADTAMVDTEAQILKSRTLISKVVTRLNLMENPEFNGAVAPPSEMSKRMAQVKSFIKSLMPAGGGDEKVVEKPQDPAVKEAAEFDGVVDSVLGRITVNRLGPTYIIEISANSADPKMAADLANTVADVYLSNQLDAKFEATRRANQWLTERVSNLREEVRNAESMVEATRAKAGLLSAEGYTLNEQAIRDLNAQLTVAELDLAQKRARLESINKQIAEGASAETIAEVQTSQTVIQLRSQYAQTSARRSQLLTRYGDKHPEVQRADNELADVQRRIDAEVRNIKAGMEGDVLVAREKVNVLTSRLNQEKARLAGNNRASVELADLQRNADASRQLYEEFLSRFKETNELEGITAPDALINSKAPVPRGPSFPKTSLNLALGFVLGLALAGVVCLITELMDNYFSTPEEVEQIAGVPYIGQVPLLPASGSFTKAKIKPAEYLIEKPHSGFAEAFRNLRASIMFADLDKAAKTVAVVSSLPEEGKTSMTYCLGRMAAMSGTKTIVIDGDIRRRQLTEVSGVPAEVGLLEYLFGETRLADAVATDEKTGLHILPLTDRKHTPRDVFGSRAFDALLNMLQQTYDLIIIDTGPVLLMAETRVVTRKVDQVVVAARWRKTTRGTLRETMKILRDFNANVAGVVLTFVDLRRRAQHSYGGASYKAYDKYYRVD